MALSTNLVVTFTYQAGAQNVFHPTMDVTADNGAGGPRAPAVQVSYLGTAQTTVVQGVRGAGGSHDMVLILNASYDSIAAGSFCFRAGGDQGRQSTGQIFFRASQYLISGIPDSQDTVYLNVGINFVGSVNGCSVNIAPVSVTTSL